MTRSRWLTRRRRRLLLAIAILLCAVLALFPQRYDALVTLTPSDPSSLGLGGALGQLGAQNTVFGTQAAVEVGLRVARSLDVREIVIKRLDLARRLGKTDLETNRWLENKIDIRSLRGGIIMIETQNRDAALAEQLVTAYAAAGRERLAEIAQTQTAYKRSILLRLVADAQVRLDHAQQAYDKFRLRTSYSEPLSSIEAIGARIPRLEAEIKSKQVQLAAAQEFATGDNMAVRQIVAEIAALRQQLAEAKATDPDGTDSVGRVVIESTRSQDLQRELDLAKSLYYGYQRFLDGTRVEDLTAGAVVRVLEPPHIETERQYNLVPLALGLFLLILGLAMEFYELRPPIEDRPVEDRLAEERAAA